MRRLAVAGICLRLASVCLVLLSVRSVVASKPDTVPDWVRTAATQTLPVYSPETDAVVLLDDTTYTVASSGLAMEHHREVVKILRPQGREAAVAVVRFDRDTKLLSFHVWSIGPDGHEYALKDNEIEEFGYNGGGILFADDRFRVAKAPGRDPGGIVAYEFDQRVRPMLTEKTWFFQSSLPHLRQSFTLELPPGFTYGAVWAHHAASPVVELEHGRWRWEMNDTPGVELRHVPMSPAEESLAGRLTVHYGGPGLALSTDGNWKSIGEWYNTLSRDRLAASPDLAAKARELTAGRTGFRERAEPIATWVQTEIRYFGIEVGIGGFQPHFAGDVFAHRYGDCKDKATLLSAMLSAVGVHAALMMVDDRRGVIDADAPSIVGNHMIAAIEVSKGEVPPGLHSVITSKAGRRYLIFDPTQDKVPFGQIPHYLQGGYGVLMEGGESQIVALPVLEPGLNTVRRSASFALQPDGSLKGTVVERRFGDVAMRRRALYTSGDLKAQTEFLDHVLGADFAQFSVADVKVEDAAQLNKDLTVSYAVEASRFARPMGSLLMLRPRVLGHEDLEPDRHPRHVPIDLGETVEVTDDYRVELPAGYTVDEMPEPVKVDMGFAAYQSTSRLEDHTLHYTRTYTVREVTLPAARYAEVQHLAGIIAADEQGQAVLKKL